MKRFIDALALITMCAAADYASASRRPRQWICPSSRKRDLARQRRVVAQGEYITWRM
jgi:hypothetical protein